MSDCRSCGSGSGSSGSSSSSIPLPLHPLLSSPIPPSTRPAALPPLPTGPPLAAEQGRRTAPMRPFARRDSLTGRGGPHGRLLRIPRARVCWLRAPRILLAAPGGLAPCSPLGRGVRGSSGAIPQPRGAVKRSRPSADPRSAAHARPTRLYGPARRPAAAGGPRLLHHVTGGCRRRGFERERG